MTKRRDNLRKARKVKRIKPKKHEEKWKILNKKKIARNRLGKYEDNDDLDYDYDVLFYCQCNYMGLCGNCDDDYSSCDCMSYYGIDDYYEFVQCRRCERRSDERFENIKRRNEEREKWQLALENSLSWGQVMSRNLALRYFHMHYPKEIEDMILGYLPRFFCNQETRFQFQQ